MQPESGCEFCEIVACEEPAREVLRTDKVVAFFPLEPATVGHTLIIPRSHIPDIWSLDVDTARELADATLRVASAVREAVEMDGLNIIQSNGQAATQTVMHLHVHVVPRLYGDDMGRIWPGKTNWSAQTKNQACSRIREAVRRSR